MKDYKVTVTGESGTISYEVTRTERGAYGVGKQVAREAFYGEDVQIIVEELI
jgi:hypothetical protein